MPASNPPAVCGSISRPARGERGWASSSAARLARLLACSELAMPSARRCIAPSSAGISSGSSRASAAEAVSISNKCPSRPKPVTSVQAVAPYSARQAEAAAAGCSIAAIASVTTRAAARRRISAARITPVPSGLVSSSRSPGCSPPLRNSLPGRVRPVTAKPSASSVPSALWPPTSTAPAASSTSLPPFIM